MWYVDSGQAREDRSESRLLAYSYCFSYHESLILTYHLCRTFSVAALILPLVYTYVRIFVLVGQFGIR